MASRSAKHRAEGGSMQNYNGAENNVEKDAEEKSRGGKAKRARGGSMNMEGDKARHRADRPMRGRKSGGSVGADMHPLTTAAKDMGGREENEDNGSGKGDVP